MHTSPVGRRKAPGFPVLETYKFLPSLETPKLSTFDAVRVCTQLALENAPILKVKAVEVDIDNNCEPILPQFEIALGDLPLVTSDLMVLTAQDLDLGKIHVEDGKLSTQSNCTFVVATKCFERKEFVEGALQSLREKGGFLVSREAADFDVNEAIANTPAGLQLITVIPTEAEKILLLQRTAKKRHITADNVVDISHDPYASDNYEWLERLKAATATSPSVIVVAQNNSNSGIIGLVNCIRKEPDGQKVSCVFIDDRTAPPFDVDNPFYNQQLQLDLAMNVYKDVSIRSNGRSYLFLNHELFKLHWHSFEF